ncbi:hypothetical protein BDW66DRAFT_12538 [Aspergillus desertorum]
MACFVPTAHLQFLHRCPSIYISVLLFWLSLPSVSTAIPGSIIFDLFFSSSCPIPPSVLILLFLPFSSLSISSLLSKRPSNRIHTRKVQSFCILPSFRGLSFKISRLLTSCWLTNLVPSTFRLFILSHSLCLVDE